MGKTFTPFMSGNIIEKAGSVDIKELIQALLSESSEIFTNEVGIEFKVPDMVIHNLMKKLNQLRLERMN